MAMGESATGFAPDRPLHAHAIRDATLADAASIAALYNVHVLDTTVTFELDEVDELAMAARVADVQARGLPWLVLTSGARLLGYAYASPWKPRAGYARTVETSIYVAEAACGNGLGTLLYAALLARLRAAGLHGAIGGTALPNPASVALHERLGFEHVGVFPEVGCKFGRWIDVGYWYVRLEAE